MSFALLFGIDFYITLCYNTAGVNPQDFGGQPAQLVEMKGKYEFDAIYYSDHCTRHTWLAHLEIYRCSAKDPSCIEQCVHDIVNSEFESRHPAKESEKQKVKE